MSRELIPAPLSEDDEAPAGEQAKSTSQDRTRRRRKSPKTLTVDEILEQLSGLPSLIALGMLSPAKASAMRATYDTLLGALTGRTASQRPQLNDADVLRMCREKPEWLDLFEPYLTNDQIDTILREQRGDADE